MKMCKVCFKEIEEDALFCPECGAKQNNDTVDLASRIDSAAVEAKKAEIELSPKDIAAAPKSPKNANQGQDIDNASVEKLIKEREQGVSNNTSSQPSCYNCIYIRNKPDGKGKGCGHPERPLSFAPGNICNYWSDEIERRERKKSAPSNSSKNDTGEFLHSLVDFGFAAKRRDCFITTAVCDSFAKPDDCYELTQFRNFRDNWLLTQPDGKQIIEKYYRIAPGIVNAINNNPEKKTVYSGIWNNYLAECLRFIENKQFKDCKQRYMQMVEDLEKEYLA